MSSRPLWRALLLQFSFMAGACAANAQTVLSMPGGTSKFGTATSLDAIQSARMDSNMFLIGSQNSINSPLATPSGSVSALDIKAPGKARREYEKGFQLLMKKDLAAAIDHLLKSTTIYPNFVAAHNALGTAYLTQGQNEQARDEFTRAIALDDHLPNSYLNLGCAQLALNKYPEAEDALKKGSAIAPLDLQLLTALAYGEFVNHDYSAVIATARRVHGVKHQGAAVVHYFAAAAFEAQNQLPEAQREMEALLAEDPKSPSAPQFRQILLDLQADQVRQAQFKTHRQMPKVYTDVPVRPQPTIMERAQMILQGAKEKEQIAEAEAEPEAACVNCGTVAALESSALASTSSPASNAPAGKPSAPMIRVAVDEVAVFFAATDHGKSVTDLQASDIDIHDDGQPPKTILGFRNESELPLRLGLVIDTSSSVRERFSFEQAAADKFLQTVVTNRDDLSFVVGVNNSVRFVQDFTADQALTSLAVDRLAPSGGTALWDAVAFAADRLANHPEAQPVARVIVVISDGQDNSSSVTLKQAIASAQRGEVAVYTVSTGEGSHEESGALLGDHALRTLAELTGGATFAPGSVRNLGGSLADLQQVIRGRYLVSYKPDAFKRDGHYRAIDIRAEKEGHKFKVYARKGYYAAGPQTAAPEH